MADEHLCGINKFVERDIDMLLAEERLDDNYRFRPIQFRLNCVSKFGSGKEVILEEGEQVEYVSLGAGNTGRLFDLETNYRVAEFKFIQWRGGPESIRQNGIFKDYFLLADSVSKKRKYLYVLGTEYPLRFLNGGRSLNSILSKDEKVRKLFYERHGDRFAKVSDYYDFYRDAVVVADVSAWLPELANVVSNIATGE